MLWFHVFHIQGKTTSKGYLLLLIKAIFGRDEFMIEVHVKGVLLPLVLQQAKNKSKDTYLIIIRKFETQLRHRLSSYK